MTNERANSTVRSAALFLALATLQVHVHELGHAVAAIALGFRPVLLYPGAVDSPAYVRNLPAVAIVAAAGPLTSLVLAAASIAAYRGVRDRATPELRLALVWLAFFGTMAAVGYLILTPFGGDTHTIAMILHWPPAVRWVAFGLGIWAMTRVAAVLLPPLAAVASPDRLASAPERGRYVFEMAVIPWLALVAGGVVSEWPLASPWGIAAFVGWGIPLLSGMSDAKKRTDLKPGDRAWGTGPLPWIAFAVYAAFLALDALVLRHGLVLVR